MVFRRRARHVVLQPKRADLTLKGGADLPGTDDHAQDIFSFPDDPLNRFDKISLAFDGLQIPHREEDFLIQREIERLSALQRVARVEEIAPEPVRYDRDRCGDVQFLDARKIALADGDDMICSVEHVFDLCPPFIVLEGEGVDIIAVPGDHEGNVVLLLEAGTGIASRPGEMGVDEVELSPTFLNQGFDMSIVPLTKSFVISICGKIPDGSWGYLHILRGTGQVYFIRRGKTFELRNRQIFPQLRKGIHPHKDVY